MFWYVYWHHKGNPFHSSHWLCVIFVIFGNFITAKLKKCLRKKVDGCFKWYLTYKSVAFRLDTYLPFLATSFQKSCVWRILPYIMYRIIFRYPANLPLWRHRNLSLTVLLPNSYLFVGLKMSVKQGIPK